MSNVVDIKTAKKINNLSEHEKMAYEFALDVDDISSAIAKALDDINASQVGAAVAMQVFINKLCEMSEYFSKEDIQKGAAFFAEKK